MFKIKDKLLMNGGMGGGMGGSCYTYAKPTDQKLLENIVPAQITFNRAVYMGGSITMDDGVTINIWGFNGNSIGSTTGSTDTGGGMSGGGMNSSGPFPSPAIRVTQGQLVHTVLSVPMMLKHTIHHHGIEPDYRSDGVGHTSWDVTGNHTYQWRPSSAGTYFYHCHTNTVLHVEMGMYGALIVDPPEGKGTAFAGGPKYDVEAIWAVDEIDSNWHKLGGSNNWTAGLCGDDVSLNDLNPDYFIITGVDATSERNGIAVSPTPSATQANSGVAVLMKPTDTLLIRYIHAGYMPQRLRLPAGLTANIIASDGHPLPNPVPITQWDTVSAERYDILIEKPAVGEYPIEFDIVDWESGNVLGIAKTNISVI
ncbi:MAG: multicopper oxidase domain-containing protein [Thiohalomonadales bacterium]